MVSREALSRRIAMAAGREPVELLITNGRIVDVFNQEIIQGSLAIAGGTIIGVGDYRAARTMDVGGRYLLPGLMDSHVHIESSLLTPRGFAATVLPMGTTTVIADPHEIANVQGSDGIRFMLEQSRELPLNIRYMLPSCVPASPFENSGAVLGAKELAAFIGEEQVLGLGEAMNFPGVVAADPAILDKLLLALQRGRVVDGHSPGLEGMGLSGYAAAGVRTDHECSTVEEMLARIRRGMYVQIREGSAVRNLAALVQGLSPANSRRCLFCTDDREPEDIIRRGHINGILAAAVAAGVEPLQAVTMATLNPAECYGLDSKGALAPGYDADLIVVEDLRDFVVDQVLVRGRLVASRGRMEPGGIAEPAGSTVNTVRIRPLAAADFGLEVQGARARVIGLEPRSILTRERIREIRADDQGWFQAELNPGLTKLAVIERHRASGNIGLGLLENYQLNRGAIATTIAHDAHNIVVAGSRDQDMLVAVRELERLGGGIVLAREGAILGALPLPVAGLMSQASAAEVGARLEELISLAHRELGVNPAIQPFMSLSFMSLSVIPELKLTDQGLLDVSRMELVDLWL
ncbi:adenine deaminase [Desulfogranum mediterraneum]|uniref:adenine deaminase n=1 Tax=Desulfogranum mediterraneum TaxID=160661 RepID=UPI00048D9946